MKKKQKNWKFIKVTSDRKITKRLNKKKCNNYSIWMATESQCELTKKKNY